MAHQGMVTCSGRMHSELFSLQGFLKRAERMSCYRHLSLRLHDLFALYILPSVIKRGEDLIV